MLKQSNTYLYFSTVSEQSCPRFPYSLIRISDALDVLVKHKRINAEIAQEVMAFLDANPAKIPLSKSLTDERTSKINEVS